MHLYRFEVTINSELVHVVIAAENDEVAFRLVDIELEKQLIQLTDVEDVSLYEKRKIGKGAGFALTKFETIL